MAAKYCLENNNGPFRGREGNNLPPPENRIDSMLRLSGRSVKDSVTATSHQGNLAGFGVQVEDNRGKGGGMWVVVSYEIDGRNILVLWAPGGQTRPYKARISLSKDNQTYAYFIRKGSSTIRARGTDEAELLSMAATVPFDDRLNRQARVEDLSPSLIQDFLNEVDSQLAPDAPALELTALGRQMNIVGGSSEAMFPSGMAMRVSNFPYEAVEEAFVNAVYHRGYDTREPVEVRIKMLRAMRQNGSPPPEFDFDEDHGYFQVRLPVQPATRNADTVVDDRHVPGQVTEQVQSLGLGR